ncbi:peptidoglycan DD-metalloendopeptidase family protein [uncultured Flavobacterium sp.]|uniref:M23 family metallopeptidase n=1 Tax=uncultured Flavobacterium sp. TaxID=165435 RepID=UPI0030CA34F4
MKHLLYLLLVITLFSCKKDKQVILIEKKEPLIKDFGITFNDFITKLDTLKSGDNFSTILENYQLNNYSVFQVTDKIKDSFNLRSIKAGKPYYLFLNKTNKQKLEYFVYVKDRTSYLVVDLRDSIVVQEKMRPSTIKRRTIAAAINGSLSETLDNEGVNAGVASKLAKIFEYSIDFFKIKKGDKFAITIQERYIQDSIYDGVVAIESSYFEYKGKKIYAFPYKTSKDQKTPSYYDEEGKGLKTMFLKAPLDYFRISSKFSGRRFHPVQQRWKAHNGTDYAAAQGTPIKTTAAGIVERKGYTAGNGNYVKVKHNATYSTQYLHMSKILVKNGQRVSQGQVIGKVGSTGLATGPHVCYRFWKNGVQVDPLKLVLPKSEPMNKKEKTTYMAAIAPLKKELDNITAIKFK